MVSCCVFQRRPLTSPKQRVVEVQDDNKQIVISENMADQEEQELFLYTTHRFTFDYVYDEDRWCHCVALRVRLLTEGRA